MNRIFLTNHAYDRMKERVGVGKKAADRLVTKAYEKGISKECAKGSLYRYMTSEARESYKNNTVVRIYGEMVYCFTETAEGALLVTVFCVPGSLRKQALGAQRRNAA